MAVAPRPRRRVSRALASPALQLLRRVIIDDNYSAFTAVPLDGLNEEEREVYNFVHQHYRQNRGFPSDEAMMENRMTLPEAPEPLPYYQQRTTYSMTVSRSVELIRELQEAIEDQDGQRMGSLLMERQEIRLNANASVIRMSDMVEVFRQNINPRENLNVVTGTGIPGLDEEVSGIRNGNIGVLAARPGVGKTFMQLAGAMHLAHGGKRVCFMTKEMNVEEITHRMLCLQFGIDPGLGLQRRVSTMAYNEIMERMRDGVPQALIDNLIFPDPASIRTSADVRATMQEHAPDMSMLDGTYFVEPVKPVDMRNRTERLEQLVRELREDTRDTNRALWMTWQQNRSKAVGTEGLYGTDALSQDASLIVIMKEPRGAEGLRVASVVKNRHGPEGIEVGLTYKFKPTNIGLRCAVPTREITRRDGADQNARAAIQGIQRTPSAQPYVGNIPDD